MMPRGACWLAIGALAAATGCAAPIAVYQVPAEQVHADITSTVLTDGTLSQPSRNILRAVNLLGVFEDDPVLALSAGHELFQTRTDRGEVRGGSSEALVALAEASFLHASRSRDRAYFVMSAIYSWAYLFGDEPRDPLDPLVRLAARLYNRGLTLAVMPDDLRQGFELEAASLELPIGTVEMKLDPSELEWGERRLHRFTPVADLAIRGFRNRYRIPGIGAPLAALARLEGGESDAAQIVNDDVRVPVSVVLVFEDVLESIDSGRFRGHIEVHSMDVEPTIRIGEESVATELEPTASLALMLAEVQPWQDDLSAFFSGDLDRGEGLAALMPHERGHIPLILVHGTASGPTTWANMINDLYVDPAIRARYEIWLFTYNTGAPILYSAYRLRTRLAEAIEALDPNGEDRALRQAVVVGHSQGGLLTKLMAVDSGDSFWRQISRKPLDEIRMQEETRKLVEGALFVRPSENVGRVVFIATPHRGSFLLTYGITNLIRNLVQAPSTVARATKDLVTQNPEGEALRRIDDTEGALGEMHPGSEFLERLLEMSLDPAIPGHSIIPVNRFVESRLAGDGVVTYKSARLDGVDSEVLVQSGHSCLDHPMVIHEMRRILLMHALSLDRGIAEASAAAE